MKTDFNTAGRTASKINSGKNRTGRTRRVVYCALMTAMLAALSQVAFPLPSGMPVTLQTFAVALCGYFGGIWGVAALCVYLLLGLVGAPVFANFKGGLGAIAGLTGGFLIGFIPFVISCSIRYKSVGVRREAALRISTGCLGLIICHLAGVWWYSLQSGNGFVPSFLTVSAPYLAKDAASVVGGYFFALFINKRLKLPFRFL